MELNTDFLVRTFFLALGGIPVTLAITIVTLAVSIPCAFVISMTRIYRVRFLRRSTPCTSRSFGGRRSSCRSSSCTASCRACSTPSRKKTAGI
jgi:hypothetical protein